MCADPRQQDAAAAGGKGACVHGLEWADFSGVLVWLSACLQLPRCRPPHMHVCLPCSPPPEQRRDVLTAPHLCALFPPLQWRWRPRCWCFDPPGRPPRRPWRRARQRRQRPPGRRSPRRRLRRRRRSSPRCRPSRSGCRPPPGMHCRPWRAARSRRGRPRRNGSLLRAPRPLRSPSPRSATAARRQPRAPRVYPFSRAVGQLPRGSSRRPPPRGGTPLLGCRSSRRSGGSHRSNRCRRSRRPRSGSSHSSRRSRRSRRSRSPR